MWAQVWPRRRRGGRKPGTGAGAYAHATATIEVLDDERLAARVAQRAVAVGPAGGGEEILGLAQVVAQARRLIGGRRQRHRLVEHPRRQLAAQRLEHRELVAFRQAPGLEIAAG